MRLMTWNINSLRLRMPLLKRLVREQNLDVICLQETKVPNALFPSSDLTELGYKHQLFQGMKSYNGVAILSRYPMQLIANMPTWCEREDCRSISALIETKSDPVQLHNFYVPAGGDIPDPVENDKFAHKLNFLEETTAWFQSYPPQRSILVGDLNVAPFEHDVWSHKQLLKIVSHTPPETSRLLAWSQTGFQDAMRHHLPEPEKLYTWWSYRNRDWKKSNRGRRLDHIWLTSDLISALKDITVLTEARDWPRPSDHAPVVMNLNS